MGPGLTPPSAHSSSELGNFENLGFVPEHGDSGGENQDVPAGGAVNTACDQHSYRPLHIL